MKSIFGSHWLLLACLFTIGCSGDSLSTQEVATSEVGLQKANESMEKASYSEALPLLDQCISQGGLNVDLLSDALVKRARCQIELGSLEAAQADLDRAEQGSAPLDQFHLTRGLLYRKQGKAPQAAEEFAKAKKLSPKIKIPG
jgi:tetratricopeptide (TPR) repeat protein